MRSTVSVRKAKKEVEENKGRKFFPVPGNRTHTLHLKRQGSSLYNNIYTAQRSLDSVAYEYHEGYILNSIAQYPMHMKERERESVIELNLKELNIAEYEQPLIDTKKKKKKVTLNIMYKNMTI